MGIRDLNEHARRQGTAWAAGTLAGRGATLHPIEPAGWDVELADGSWIPCETWQELCEAAHTVLRGER